MGKQVVAIDVNLKGLVAGLISLLKFFNNVRVSGSGCQRWQHVGVREYFVRYGSGLDHSRPPDSTWDPPAAFPIGVFFATEWRRATVGPAHHLGPVVRRVHHDRVVGYLQR